MRFLTHRKNARDHTHATPPRPYPQFAPDSDALQKSKASAAAAAAVACAGLKNVLPHQVRPVPPGSCVSLPRWR
jgi:hypothetical protein